jgi:hypothetical protein
MRAQPIFEKTPKALEVLAQRGRELTPRQRALLLLVNGQRSLRELEALMGQPVADPLQSLLQGGYLQPANLVAAEPPPDDPVVAEPPVRVATVADRFTHGRSVAAARMYLFDMTERFFARAQPERAQQLRDLFRQARDVAELVESAWLLLAYVKALAGEERAEGIRLRLATMLPEGALDAVTSATESSEASL